MDFQQLAQELNKYCIVLKSQLLNDAFPVDTSGIPAVTEALNNPEFIETACKSFKEDYQYNQCTHGSFSFYNELLGLKNSVSVYNDLHSKYTLYMLSNDVMYVHLYISNLL